MNSDMVKPIPVKRQPAAKRGQLKRSARVARPRRTASQLKVRTPIGLPKTNPAKIATAKNDCKGQNACKGQGYLNMTKEECDAIEGATFEPVEG